jgi:curved DNA-binding protein CbpA
MEIEEMLRRCDSSGCYEILGLKRVASGEEIESAYYSLSQRFHPDRHFSLPSHDIKERLIRIFSYITRAHEILMDPEKRDAYDREPLLVKDAAPEEISEKMFALSGITGPDRPSGEKTREIPEEAEGEAAVPVEEARVSEEAGKTHEPAGAVGEMPLQQMTVSLSEAVRASPETASEEAGEIPEEFPADGNDGDLSESGPETFTVEETGKRGHDALMPIAIIVAVVVVVAAVASLMFKDREEVSLSHVSHPASEKEEVNRGESREVFVELPTFRDDLFRKFLNESGDRMRD